jgi:transcriptional regulator with XRE-family HTH domain
MARAALNWSVQVLAVAANVGEATVRRFEQGRAIPIPATAAAIRAALETAGVRFTDDGCVCPPSTSSEDTTA